MDTARNSKYILKLGTDHERVGTRSEINVLDSFAAKYQVKFALLYRQHDNCHKLDVEKFLISIKKSLEYYPEFTGTIERTRNKSVLDFNNNGVEFSICQLELDAHGAAEEKIFIPHTEPGEPALLKIKMTVLNNDSYVLGFSFSHGVCDACGFIWFLKVWSTIYQNGQNFILSKSSESGFFGSYRSSLIEDRFKVTGCDSKRAPELCYEYFLKNKSGEFLNNGVSRNFLFRKKSLFHIKEEYSKTKKASDPQYLSTLDILAAILWKALITCKDTDETEVTTYRSVSNFRKKLNLSDSYFGNCAIAFHVNLTVSELLKLDITEVATLIRKEINKLDEKAIKSKLAYMESAEDWRAIRPNIDFTNGKYLILSSWETFPIFDIEFNCGKPKNIFHDLIGQGASFIFPTINKNELKIYLNLKKEDMSAFLEDRNVMQYLKGKQNDSRLATN